MSPRLPRLTSKALVGLVETHGFHFDRQKGSHAVFIHPDGRRVTIPMHSGRVIGTGLLLQVLRDADIDPDTLRKREDAAKTVSLKCGGTTPPCQGDMSPGPPNKHADRKVARPAPKLAS